MQLTRFTDLALRAMMLLAAGENDEQRVTTRQIAAAAGASEHHIAKAVSRLVDLGRLGEQDFRRDGALERAFLDGYGSDPRVDDAPDADWWWRVRVRVIPQPVAVDEHEGGGGQCAGHEADATQCA